MFSSIRPGHMRFAPSGFNLCTYFDTPAVPHSTSSRNSGHYAGLVARLRRTGTPLIELAQGDARVLVAPGLQGRVLTSSFRPDGRSLGWINLSAIEAGEQHIAFNNFGGQDRFWLGPEGGQFSLYFAPGDEQTLDHWLVPAEIDRGAFAVVEQDTSAVHMKRTIRLTNASGTQFRVLVDRSVRLVSCEETLSLLEVEGIPEQVAFAGYLTANRLINGGQEPMTPDGGTISIWSMGMFPVNDRTAIIAPYAGAARPGVIRSDYFGAVPGNRLKIQAGAGLLRADGLYRSKIGLGPMASRGRIAAIDFEHGVLTIAQTDPPPAGARYVNSLWTLPQADPFDGDVLNAYNNNAGGSDFYELESSSPAAFLAPGEAISHTHRTLQFQGPVEALTKISEKALGVALADVQRQMW